MKLLYLISLLLPLINYAQSDTTHYTWPTPQFNSSKSLTATFGEFRNTGSSDHFHNAVDIGEPDGNPVYPCIDGTVYNLSDNGYDSYINVKSIINGEKKHMTYYHVVPNPSLTVGQTVKAGQTIIGTIYVGAAHVHLIERELLEASYAGIGNEINPVRPEGGLSPYFDTYTPVINESSLKFFKDQSAIEVPADQLTGKVDIRIDVRERNGTSSSHINNGTYILGYRVLSNDGENIIYEPANEGIKYRFYYLPFDNYVHNVFVKNVATLSDPIYWLTNGSGEKTINSTLSVTNNYLNTDILDEGQYLLEIFSEDTRGNKTSKRFPFSVVKQPPEFLTAISRNDSLLFSWSPYKLNSLIGYRLYYSNLNSIDNWKLAADENSLGAESNQIAFENTGQFADPTQDQLLKFYITAVDSQGTESAESDTYSLIYRDSSYNDFLIIDGFDRYGGTGSWSQPNHDFNTIYSSALSSINDSINIVSCSNEAIINEDISLNDYDFVTWFMGDESIQDNTLTNSEQHKIALYLDDGGRLLISGEDIGQDLDTKHSYNEFTDTLFYHQYLKAQLMHDGLDLLFEVNGEEGSLFEGLNVPFGVTYPSDAPDDIEPINGSVPILNYTYMRDETTFRKGGIAYQGTFGNSSKSGAFVYLSFPFETIGDENIRNTLMKKILQFLEFNIVDVEEKNSGAAQFYKYELKQNYPNPFNPTTTITYEIPPDLNGNGTVVRLVVYDILGREVHTLVNGVKKQGNYDIQFDASNYPSGIYYYQLKTNNYIETKKMVLIK